MSRRLSAYLLLAALTVTSAVAAWIHVGSRQSRAELALVRADILDADWGLTRARLDALAGTIGTRRRALAGLAVIEALTSEQDFLVARVAARDLSYYPVGLLLQRALAEERYQGCLRLVALLRRAGAPDFPEFEAAALLEQGRPELARAVTIAGTQRTRVRRALAEVLSGDLDDVLVRDRDGALLGKARRTEVGGYRFTPERGLDPAVVPAPAVEALHSVLPARSVRLTVDREMSEMALRALGPYRGSIVVLDPIDGSVLAAVSDRRTAAEGGTPALEQMREPASIAKLITVTAALRAGLDVDAILNDMTCRGSMRLGDGVEDVLYCAAVNGRLRGLDRALAVSCNVAFAHLGELVGREALLEEFRRYGFGYDGDESSFFGKVLSPQGSPRQLGDLSIGLEATSITPVHAALEAATVANGGWMHPPRLYRSTDTFLGFSERSLPAPAGWQVLDAGWRPMLTRAMIAVAQPGGTAARIAPPYFPVALKTGTASEPDQGFHVNYIGFGPLPETRFAFAVRVTHQPSSRRVRSAAFAVTRRFLEGLARFDAPSPPAPLRRGTVVANLGTQAAGGG
jgi:Penicillin binding protein transpeptidase domain